jgi:hypothetical protein
VVKGDDIVLNLTSNMLISPVTFTVFVDDGVDEAQTIRDTLLTGISFVSTAAVTAGNKIIEAVGQLQAQINVIFASLNNKFNTSDIDTDGALTANSDSKVASQKAVRIYVAANAGGSGSSSSTVFNIDAKPSSGLNAKSDWFEGNSLDAKWALFNNSYSTKTVADNRLTMQMPSYSGDHINGIVQALPAGDCTIITKVWNYNVLANFSFQGLGLIQNLVEASSGIVRYALVSTAVQHELGFDKFSNLDTYAANYAGPPGVTTNVFNYDAIYLRFSRSGTTWTASYSNNGKRWNNGGSVTEATIGWTPGYFGLIAGNLLHGNTNNFYFEFIQYTSVANDTLKGGKI